MDHLKFDEEKRKKCKFGRVVNDALNSISREIHEKQNSGT